MFVATEFIEGEVLSAVLSRGHLPTGQVARIGREIALAIAALWVERLVHRDIKPNNIMFAHNGRAVLIDLGVARHLSLGALTTLGKTWGTDGYMSPEQANALRQLSCKSDIFSLVSCFKSCCSASIQRATINWHSPEVGLNVLP